MITYACFKKSPFPNSYVIDFSNETDSKYLDFTNIVIKDKEIECSYKVNFLSCTGLNPRIIVDNDYLLIGVDYGTAIIGNDLKIINIIRSDFLFCDAMFYKEKILVIFECEFYIYDTANNLIKSIIPLKDAVNDFFIEKNHFIYNTIDNSNYNRVYIGNMI